MHACTMCFILTTEDSRTGFGDFVVVRDKLNIETDLMVDCFAIYDFGHSQKRWSRGGLLIQMIKSQSNFFLL